MASRIRGAPLRIPEQGGEPLEFAIPEDLRGHVLWLPQALPGAREVMFTVSDEGPIPPLRNPRLAALSFGGDLTPLVDRADLGSFVRGSASGHYLVFQMEGLSYAVAFDVGRLEAAEAAIPLPDARPETTSAQDATGSYGTDGSFSWTGNLVYREDAGAETELVPALLDADGHLERLSNEFGRVDPAVSPDGGRIAFSALTRVGSGIQVYDRATAQTTMPASGSLLVAPLWHPDEQHLVYLDVIENRLVWVRADGSGQPITLHEGEPYVPTAFSGEGDQLFIEKIAASGRDVLMLDLDLSSPDRPSLRKTTELLTSPRDEGWGRLSPNGQMIAYVMPESDALEIWVRPFPDLDQSIVKVSTEGGQLPRRHPNGRQLFYQSLDGYIMVVDYTIEDGMFHATSPRRWAPIPGAATGGPSFDIIPNEDRVIVLVPADPEAARQARDPRHAKFVLNFADHLRCLTEGGE